MACIIDSVDVSIQIFEQWCTQNDIDEKHFCDKLNETLVDVSVLLISGQSYAGHEAVVESFCDRSKHYTTLVEGHILYKHCKDLNLLYIRHCGTPSDVFLSSLGEKNIPTILVTIEPSRSYNNFVSFQTRDIPFAWFDAIYNPLMWDRLLTRYACYGCLVNHPSQIQHMGTNGCLHDGYN